MLISIRGCGLLMTDLDRNKAMAENRQLTGTPSLFIATHINNNNSKLSVQCRYQDHLRRSLSVSLSCQVEKDGAL